MLFEIINPSDPYTMEAPDLEVAACAVAVLGRGAYGLNELSGDKSGNVPMFPVTGHDEWFTKQFGRNFDASLNHVFEQRADALAKALASVFIGTAIDKRVFEQEAAGCQDEEAFQKLLTARHDAARTSVNDIGRQAWAFADMVAAKALEQQSAVSVDST